MRYLSSTQLGEVKSRAAAGLPRRRPRRAARVRRFAPAGRHRRPTTPRTAPRHVPRATGPGRDVLLRTLVGLENLAVTA